METLRTLSLSCTVGGLPDSGPEAFSVLLQDCPRSQWSRPLAPVAAGSGPAETSRWCGEEDCGWTADVMPPSLDMGGMRAQSSLYLDSRELAVTSEVVAAGLELLENKLQPGTQGK